jgi:hypothetical protein
VAKVARARLNVQTVDVGNCVSAYAVRLVLFGVVLAGVRLCGLHRSALCAFVRAPLVLWDVDCLCQGCRPVADPNTPGRPGPQKHELKTVCVAV